MTAYTDVLFETISGKAGDVGVITLNRPEVLNSLDHGMIQHMYTHLNEWKSARTIKAVIIRAAEGRAFCAGGDLRLTHDRWLVKDRALSQFFYEEYHLNRLIFHFPKPYIALLDGITMGGGVGISIHGSHRVATDRLLFAMPETGIGFYPDVGGTYFLPRLPGKTGYYLGLTGARLDCDTSVALGVATLKVARESLNNIIRALADEPLDDRAGLSARQRASEVLNQFNLPIQPSHLLAQQAEIDHCFAGDRMEAIISLLQQSRSPLMKEAIAVLAKKSPTSLKVTLKALQEGKELDFDECMKQEYRLTCHFLEGHDFAEGIRAIIIDKDQAPVWDPATLNEVSHREVLDYFAPLSKELV